MKTMKISILVVVACIAVLFATTAFIISDPQADFSAQNVNINDIIALSEITTKNSEKGTFKSTLKLKQHNFDSRSKEFYGQKITIAGNPHVDQIYIGVTNNLISRIEIWNDNNLVESKELGFIDKMTWGEIHTLSVDFYDETNEKYREKSKISMRFFDGTGFFGDIGTINFDLTGYGDFSGNKSVGAFAKSIDSNSVNEPQFSDLRIWKNYKSFD